MKLVRFACRILLACGPGAGGLRADPGHEKIIATLTEQIGEGGRDPALYFQRGWNYREMPQPPVGAARADFVKALELEADFLPAQRELARLDAEEGKLEEAVVRLREAVQSGSGRPAAELAGCWSLLADFLLLLNRSGEAQTAAEAGLKTAGGLTLDLTLTLSEALRRLHLEDDRIRCLTLAAGAVRSAILEDALTDALIDARRGAEAGPRVERELAVSRWKAPWLIRRARLRLADGNQKAASGDLQTALAEIAGRVADSQALGPDVFCDRGTARALLGETTAARQDLSLALSQGAESWRLRVLESLLPLPPPRGK